MIKNIVFDMGNVLVSYSPYPVIRQFVSDPADQELVKSAIFVSPEWVFLDMDVLTDEQALEKMLERLPERLHDAGRACMRDWHLYNMEVIGGMEELLRELKAKGYGIYVCSNAAIRLADIWRGLFPAPECFDGVLFSAEVKCIKPQKEIYQHLFERFGLVPEECYFIDDLPNNIEGARECGMDGCCYAKIDVDNLRKHLFSLNV